MSSSGPRDQQPPQPPGRAADKRHARSAEALRANLKRRKTQARERGAGDTPRLEVSPGRGSIAEDE